MKTLLLFVVLNLVGCFADDQFALNVNGEDCSFPADSMLFPGRTTICGLVPPANVFSLEVFRNSNVTFSTLYVNSVDVPFAMSDSSKTIASPSCRTWVGSGDSIAYFVKWPESASSQTWGVTQSFREQKWNALWFGSFGGVCPLQVDFWHFDTTRSRWTLDAVTCVVQFSNISFSYVMSLSKTDRFIGIGTQGNPSPSPTLWDKGWSGVFKVHNIAFVNTSNHWCDANVGVEIHIFQTNYWVRVRIPFRNGVVDETFQVASREEFTAKILNVDVLFRVFDERLYIMDAFNRYNLCVLAATRSNETPVLPPSPDDSSSAKKTMWIAIIVSLSTVALLVSGYLAYRWYRRRTKPADPMDFSLLSSSEQGV